MASPESSVSSLLATSGRLQSSLHPQPVSTFRYKDKRYASASEALDAYIRDFQRSQRDSGTGTLELPRELAKPHPRNTDVLKTSLTDGELNFLNIPVRKRDADGLSVTTDDLLALPNDGSLPVTRTSALLSRSGSFPLGLSFNSSSRSHSRSAAAQKRAMPASRKNPLPMDDLLMGGLRSHRQAPPNIPLANQMHTPRSSYLPRWMTSQRSEMDFSGMTSVPDLKYPLWLRQCEGSSDGQRSERPPGVPSWVRDLEESSRATQSDTKDGQMLNAPSLGLREPHNSSGDTEDALDADRSWDNPPVVFKSPVPVGGAEEPQPHEELQRSKSAASCSSGYSSRKHPGPVEALKHMLFRLQAVEHKISQSHASSEAQTPQLDRETLDPVPQEETEETDVGSGESLRRALHHLDRLKTLVDDMNERKARAEEDGTDANITNGAGIKKQL